MNIRILQESDAKKYKELRLNGLKNDPEAFGSTYDREVLFSMETIIDRIRPSSDKFVLGAFTDQNELVGIASFVRESNLKTAHKGNIYGMYVSQENRGRGIGKLLIHDLINKVRDCIGLEQINLAVVSTNEAAKYLYKSNGFETYGIERNALKFNNQYFDEDLMTFHL
ncbi:acetyltransferase [Bacillus sp. FJAT-18019]|nr:acetyltransferase [Bacillus sp. FJAT-18019]